MGVAGAYLRLQSNQASVPITALTHVHCPERSFPGICLTQALTIHVDRDEFDIPMKLIRSIKAASRRAVGSLVVSWRCDFQSRQESTGFSR